VERLLQDVRIACRSLGRNPGFAVAAVLTLALGIGANTAIFSVIDAVLLDRLPYEHARELAMLWRNNPDGSHGNFSPALFVDLRREVGSFSDLTAYDGVSYNLTGAGEPERVEAVSASANVFSTLGVEAAVGRLFRDGDPEGRVAVLTHGFWQRRFGGDPTAVGSVLRLDGEPYTVVGVLPAAFRFPLQPDAELWTRAEKDVPPWPWTGTEPDFDLLSERGLHYFNVFGRLAPGTALAVAHQDLDRLAEHYAEQFPDIYGDETWGLTAVPFHGEVVGEVRPALLLLLAAVGLLLLIACVNVANLMLARGVVRQRETAVRAALGAGRRRLVEQVVAEALVIAVAGSGVGLLLGVWGLSALLALLPPQLSDLGDVRLDGAVLAFTLLLSVGSVLVFALVPAVQASRPRLRAALAGDSIRAGSRTGVARRALVVTQTALALVLLVGAGLLVRSFVAVASVDPGFDAEGVLTARVSLPDAAYPEAEQQEAFFASVLDRLAATPGVETSSAVLSLPFSGSGSYLVLCTDSPEPSGERGVGYQVVAPGYFRTLGVPFLSGRPFEVSDRQGSAQVVVVSRSFAEREFPGGDALGHRVSFDCEEGSARTADSWWTIVGVAADVHHTSFDTPQRAEVYLPFAQDPWQVATLLVRAAPGTSPRALEQPLRRAVAALDADLPLYRVRPMSDYLARSLAQRRFVLLLVLVFAAVAALLAAVGIYGVVSWSVAAQRRDIGIRLALGASRRRVVGAVLAWGVGLALAGVAAGVALALPSTRLLAGLLFGVGNGDPLTYVAVSGLLTALAGVAALRPARQAANLDPMVVLRGE
jgi:putative ABC transport system permease protein